MWRGRPRSIGQSLSALEGRHHSPVRWMVVELRSSCSATDATLASICERAVCVQGWTARLCDAALCGSSLSHLHMQWQQCVERSAVQGTARRVTRLTGGHADYASVSRREPFSEQFERSRRARPAATAAAATEMSAAVDSVLGELRRCLPVVRVYHRFRASEGGSGRSDAHLPSLFVTTHIAWAFLIMHCWACILRLVACVAAPLRGDG